MRVGREPTVRVPAEDGVGHLPEHGGDQLVAQRADLGGEPLAPLGGDHGGHREGGDGGHVEGPGAHVPLLAAAVQDGYGALVAAEQQRADAVRAADLVAADGHRGEAAVAEADVELTEGLDGVGVQGDGELAGHGGQFMDRHDGADLVVGPHDGGQGHVVGVARDGFPQGLGVHAAVPVDGEVLDPGALVLAEPVDGVEDGVVLDGAGEHPGPGGVLVAPGPVEALDGEVVGLRAARGEDHLARAGAECLGEGLAGLLDGTAGTAAGGMEEDALPVAANCAVIAAAASGSIGVVAAWSR